MIQPSEEKVIPITITGNTRCTCHVIQERTLNGSVNVCISTWVNKPVISQSTYDRLKSNDDQNAVSKAENLDNRIKMKTPVGTLRGRKKTKLTLYRGNQTNLLVLADNLVTIVCIIVTGMPEKFDIIAPRSSYQDMRLRFMRRIIGGGWKTLWGQLYIGTMKEPDFHVYHTEEYDPLHSDISNVWSYTRRHRLFNAFVPLVDNSAVNYPLGCEHPPETDTWFKTLLISSVRGSLYRDLCQLIKENPNWDLNPPAIHRRVSVPREYDLNEWAFHEFISNLANDATDLQNLETHDEISDKTSDNTSTEASTDSTHEIMHGCGDVDPPIVRPIWGNGNPFISIRKYLPRYLEEHHQVSDALIYNLFDFAARKYFEDHQRDEDR